ncbi:TRAP transporter small permease subunit [Sulfitobacter sp. HNIBRBA3233]|uniref:TRAP transporter small permease subunit n=1 Tax=Sulfitobacter marinivivus TaxID=3158558 RepID=UPI0032DF639F
MSGASDTSGLLSRLRQGIDALTLALNVIGTLMIVAVMLLVNADVIGRAAFSSPIAGVPMMVSMSIVAIVFLQVAQAFRMGRLTRSDALLGALARRFARARSAVEALFCAAAIFIMVELLRASAPLFAKAWTRGTFEGTIGSFTAPIWPVKLIILIGSTALIVQLVISAIVAICETVAPRKAPDGKL